MQTAIHSSEFVTAPQPVLDCANTGCVSEESIIEDQRSDADYQQALKQLGDLFRDSSNSYLTKLAIQRQEELKLTHYDAEGFDLQFESNAYISDNQQITDEEIESCGYMGWLEH